MSARPPDPSRYEQALAQKDALIAELHKTLAESQRLNEQLRYRIDLLLRRMYGPRSERIDPSQLTLFAEKMAEPVEPEPPTETEAEPGPARKSKGHGRRPLPADLPRELIEHPVAPEEVPCPCCGQDRTRMGEEISEQLEYVPAKLLVLRHVRPKLVCKKCLENVVIAPMPAMPIEKGLPGPGLVAHVITCKYDDHLPLHRLEHILARHGVEISRSTMCGWTAAAADLLEPLYRRMAELIRQGRIINTDDTTVPVLDPKLDKTRTGRLWVYIGDKTHPYTLFDYTPTRAGDGPLKWLDGFAGHLQCDAYSGYDGLSADGKIREVGCWAHARRYFYDARATDPPRAHAAMAFIRRLYEVEDMAKGLDAAARRQLRQEQSKPVSEELRVWLESQRPAVLSAPTEAISRSVRVRKTTMSISWAISRAR